MSRELRIDENLIIRAAEVARQAPAGWALFCDAVDAAAADEAKKLVQSSAATIYTAQGRAQHAAQMASTLRDAVAAADRLQAKLNGSPSGA